MNQHRQLLFLLGVTCLTAADVALSTKDNLDTEIISSREVSRTEPPPQSEPSSQVKLPLRDEPPSQSQVSTRSQLTTRVENSTHFPCNSGSNEDVNESTISASTTVSVGTVTDGLRDQVIRLTNELSKMVAALQIAQQRERKLAVLEREKYRCNDIIKNTTMYNIHTFMYVYATINVNNQPQLVSDFGLMLYLYNTIIE